MIWVSSRKRRLQLTLALLVGLLVIGTIVAHTHGAKPDPGATYTGTVFVQSPAGKPVQQLAFSFSVSASGHRVTDFRLPRGLPSLCSATQLGMLVVESGSAPIRNPSRFILSLAITGAGQPAGRLEISGNFHTLNRESGAMAASYSSPGARVCDASGGYTAKLAG